MLGGSPIPLPSWDELSTAISVVRLPMRESFRGITEREALLVHGPAGWGEFSPFLEYDDDEASRWLAAGLEAAWVGWPDPVRDAVPVNATVPAVSADRVPEVLARFPGCTTAKVKVAQAGQALRDDVDRVAAVRDVLGPTGRVRVDANGAWAVGDALRAATALAPNVLEYVEQPCASIEELTALRSALARAGVDVLIAADESVRKAEDPLRVARAGAADIVVLKVAPLAGVAAALAIAAECRLPVVVSSALDTAVGISAGLALAASLPDLPHACGLATTGLLAADVVHDRPLPVGGFLPVRTAFPDPDLLTKWAVAPDRHAWWLARLRRCHRLLTEGAAAFGR
jgi:O-succinylbenzoate synthase